MRRAGEKNLYTTTIFYLHIHTLSALLYMQEGQSASLLLKKLTATGGSDAYSEPPATASHPRHPGPLQGGPEAEDPPASLQHWRGLTVLPPPVEELSRPMARCHQRQLSQLSQALAND